MSISWLQALLIAALAYLGMSVWPLGVGYFTLYRPLIGGLVVGLVLGDAKRGMVFGAALNAIHLGFISTGGTLPSDLVTAGYIGTALALTSGLDVEPALAAFGIPLGVLGAFLWFARMTLGSGLVQWADRLASRGDTAGVAAVNLWAGQALLFLLYAVPTFVIVFWGQWGIERVLGLLPQRLLEALAVVGGMLPAVGIGLLLRSIGKVRLAPFLLFGFVATTYLGLPVLVVALLGAGAAWLVVERVRSEDVSVSVRSRSIPTRESRVEGELECVEPGLADQRSTEHRVPARILRAAWVRWFLFLHASYNYERMQGLGFAHAMRPVIEHLYATKEERARALQRHLLFFNSEPQFGALVPAAVVALEEQRASGADISQEAINGIKSSLMGPLAGVGDSLIQGLITPLLLSLGITLALEGRFIGPVLYVGLISTIVVATSRLFWRLGYRWGCAAVSRVLESGWVSALTEGTSVVGTTVAGALIASVVHVSTPISVGLGQGVIALQSDVLDAILLNALPAALTLGAWWLLERGIPSMRLISVLFVVGVLGTYIGVLGSSSVSLFSRDWVVFLAGGLPVTSASLVTHLWPVGLTVVAACAWWAFGRHAQSDVARTS